MMESFPGKKIVLIGGAGFIGHHLALGLVERGIQVEIIDSLQVNNFLSFTSSDRDPCNRELYLKMINQRLALLREAHIPLYIQDARDYHALNRLLSQVKPDVIVHLAAVAHAGRSNKDPYSTFDHSLRTLENALDWSRHGLKQFIFLSSSTVYGNFIQERVDEEHPLNSIGIYGALKVAGERLVVAYHQVFGLPYTIIRPSALYGPRCVSRRVLQVFIENAMAGERLQIHGDGEERLDFTYIDDLVEGIYLAIQNPKAIHQTLNLTQGASRSIREVLLLLKEHFPNIQIDMAERDELMPMRGTLNIDKASALLGYCPKNHMEIGLPKYIAWYKDFLGYPTEKLLALGDRTS